ncbi:hypothetical protein QQZ08_001366 [Neonectria magnoliae]|uniref:Glucose-methanol-choline oxidoreductase C-terminal domain-containing protein n=1 Tax=Neonectria magnoliae TaxID=2732573 RepID=A0ABR1IGZ7_9HYPO
MEAVFTKQKSPRTCCPARIDKYLEKSPEYVAFKESNGGIDPFGPAAQPHFETDFVPMFCDAFQWHIPTPPEGDYMTVIVDLLRPLSKNETVTLNSANPLDQANININFFSNDLDLVAMRQGVRFVDHIILNGDGMKDFVEEDYPWATPRTSDDYGHYDQGAGAVDSKLKIFGVDNLRVIDASIIPVIPDCRIQNLVYMIAEKGADMIKAAYPSLYA